MYELGRDGLYVVNHRGEPIGLVSDVDVVRAHHEGKHDLSYIIKKDFPVTNEKASLIEVYRVAAGGLPVAVLSEDGRLLGVVNEFDLLTNASLDSSLEAHREMMKISGKS
jgi:CBS domain-containing protein